MDIWYTDPRLQLNSNRRKRKRRKRTWGMGVGMGGGWLQKRKKKSNGPACVVHKRGATLLVISSQLPPLCFCPTWHARETMEGEDTQNKRHAFLINRVICVDFAPVIKCLRSCIFCLSESLQFQIITFWFTPRFRFRVMKGGLDTTSLGFQLQICMHRLR